MRALASIFAVIVALAGGSAQAQTGWQNTDQGQVRLIAAQTAVGDGADIRLGLHFKMAKGWKIYWRSPGDAGYPPKLDWKGSDNLAEARMLWPIPNRFTVLGLQTIGYKDEVVLPILVRPENPAQALRLKLTVDYLVCDQICIPVNLTFGLDLAAGPAAPDPEAHRIDQFVNRVPGAGTAQGLSLLEARLAGTERLIARFRADPPLKAPDLFVEGPEGAAFDAPKIRLQDGGGEALLALDVTGQPKGGLGGAPLVLTLVDGARALEVRATPTLGPPEPPLDSPPISLLAMVGFALLGGLILNLMPCVLPVLSIKVMSLVGHGGAGRRSVRQAFLATAAGIVVSFLALALAAIAVKAAGQAVGWGIQFQQPLFLIALALIVTLFAANLWGLFEIPLPGWLGGIGKGYGHPHSLAGHFAAGLFATLLATPCTAPFLGTAVGFALSHGPAANLAIFALLGLGMATPYLAIALWPGFATRLPRPGPWMITLRRVLGVALAGTAGWLVSVLIGQIGLSSAILIALLLALMIGLLAGRNRLETRRRGLAAIGLAGLAILVFLVPSLTQSDRTPTAKADALWRPFDAAAIGDMVAEGKTVLVDVTADWCITCQVNKATVLNRGETAKRLAAGAVVAMRADWTRPDPAIAAFLARHGRYGIPFNIVYGPGAPEGLALPELLTEGAVIDALDRASRRR